MVPKAAKNHLIRLNNEQKEAVAHGDGPLLIIAGAGTGKTTVVTERIKYLITERGVKSADILALTFTEKAAKEMEERVDISMPYGYTQMWILTFHSFCDRILRQEALNIGLDPKYHLMTESEAIQFIRKNLFLFKLDYFRPLGNPNKFIEGILQHFSRLGDEDITSNEYQRWVEGLGKDGDYPKEEIKKWKELADAYEKYEDLKAKESVMDFGDLISKTLKLLRERPNIRSFYQEKFKYILVDEFQDTNFAQNELAILLSGKKKNLTVCGDDDQAIYRWRGAAVSNMIQFRKHFPESKIVILKENYRSYQEILDKSYDLIQYNNPDRLEVTEKINKKLISTRSLTDDSRIDKSRKIEFIHADRVENEADFVAKKIRELTESKNYQFGEIAILVRANNHAEVFTRALERRGVPFQFLGPGRLFKQSEVIDLICFLKVLYNFEDSVSLYRVLSMDYFEISPRDLAAIGNYAKRYSLCLFEACEKVDDIFVSDMTKRKIKELVGIFERYFKLLRSETAGQLVYYFLQDTGYLQYLVNPNTPYSEKKAANVSKFFDKLKSYEVDHEDASVMAIVDWIELAQELGESPLAADTDWTLVNAVSILTLHSAKGLEFPVVFIVNLVEKRFPTIERREQIPIPEALIKEVLPVGDYHMEEERRLFYVGMTRARDKLFLTAANYYGEGKREKKLSPFIFESLGDMAVSAEVISEKGQQLTFLDYTTLSKPSIASLGTLPFHVDYLSYSQIETFKTCPLHYKLKYLYKIPTPPTSAQSFGISVHAALKDFYFYLKNGEKPTLNLLFAALEKNWKRDGYLGKKHQEKALEEAKSYLVNYFEKEFDKEKIPFATELPFVVSLLLDEKKQKRVKIGGKIDRVDVLPDGRVEIVDYKTGANIPTQKEVNNDRQLTFYALAASLIKEPPFGRKADEILLTLYYLDNQKKFSTTRTLNDLENAKAEILLAKETIEKSDFKCSRGYFCVNNCEYSVMCGSEGD